MYPPPKKKTKQKNPKTKQNKTKQNKTKKNLQKNNSKKAYQLFEGIHKLETKENYYHTQQGNVSQKNKRWTEYYSELYTHTTGDP